MDERSMEGQSNVDRVIIIIAQQAVRVIPERVLITVVKEKVVEAVILMMAATLMIAIVLQHPSMKHTVEGAGMMPPHKGLSMARQTA